MTSVLKILTVPKSVLLQTYVAVRASYWFVPSLMALLALLFGAIARAADRSFAVEWLYQIKWLANNNPDDARILLSTIASSMITVAGVSFSMTMVAVSFASAQFGPRLIGNFMRDRGNQVTLGTFIATFVYCITILQGITSGSENNDLTAFVPVISLLLALVLAAASLGVLIYFIHHVPETINVGNLTAKVGLELKQQIARMFPNTQSETGRVIEGPTLTKIKARQQGDFIRICANTEGYVQALDLEGLVEVAQRSEMIIEVRSRPGDFVVNGAELVRVYDSRIADEEVVADLRAAYAFGDERTATQNLFFLVDELVEILARALSPGTNDPFTAISCLNWLHVGLVEMSRREAPSAYHCEDEGRSCVIASPISFEEFAARVCDQSRPYVATDRNVSLHMMAMLSEAALGLPPGTQRNALVGHAEALLQSCQTALPASDCDALVARLDELKTAMKEARS